ncbi:hypothetical protein YC2023_019261 [Brassica napus]
MNPGTNIPEKQSFRTRAHIAMCESIISIIVECNLPAIKPWWFCIVGVFPWLVRHGGLIHPENSLEGLLVLWNKKRNLKPPWPWRRLCRSFYFDILIWTMVTPLIQRDAFHLYLTTRGNRARLCEDMEWETMELSACHCQYEGLFMMWIGLQQITLSPGAGSVWNGQRCNRCIASTDLLSGKSVGSQTQNHIRSRTKIDKVSESNPKFHIPKTLLHSSTLNPKS